MAEWKDWLDRLMMLFFVRSFGYRLVFLILQDFLDIPCFYLAGGCVDYLAIVCWLGLFQLDAMPINHGFVFMLSQRYLI